MSKGRLSKLVSHWLVHLERFTDRPWYLPVLALLAAADLFILVVPTDGLLVSAVMLRPKRWITAFLWFSIGSSLGALGMGAVVQHFGDPLLHRFAGDALTSATWIKTAAFIEAYGPWAIGLSALGPFPIQPPVLIAAAAGMPLGLLFLSMLVGRAMKYAFFAWIGSHAPRLISRLWIVREEVAEIAEAEAEERSPRSQ